MVSLAMKTVRFSDVIKQGGAPRLHTLWAPPQQDREFQQALKTHRILTVHEENVGTRKDHGEVGFHPEGHAQFLIFPRSLKAFGGKRVIGINFDWVGNAHLPLAAPVAESKKKAARTARSQTKRARRKSRAQP